MKKQLLFYILFFAVKLVFAQQKDLKVPVNQTVVINYIDYVVYAQILTTDNKVKIKDELYYYWFKANDIKITRGGFDGKLLHGTYTVFYENKNLKEKGEFRYGLKNGEWKSWRENGEYYEISNWHKGKKHGKTKIYNEKGILILECNYKEDDLHGKSVELNKDGSKVVKKYKCGLEKKARKKWRPGFGKKNKEKTEVTETTSQDNSELEKEKSGGKKKKERKIKENKKGKQISE